MIDGLVDGEPVGADLDLNKGVKPLNDSVSTGGGRQNGLLFLSVGSSYLGLRYKQIKHVVKVLGIH